jgi:hypothetical protein
VQTLIGLIEKRIRTQHRANEASQRVETIPGIKSEAMGRQRTCRELVASAAIRRD